MSQCQIPRSTSVTDVLVDCDTHVLTVVQTSPSGKESHQTVDLSCILPSTSKVTDVFYDCDAQQLVVTQITDGVCAGGDCTETFVVSLACILDETMPSCDKLNSTSPMPAGSEVMICTPDGPKTTPPSALLPEFDCSNLPTACCPRPEDAMFFACSGGKMVVVPPNDLLTCDDFELANPIPTDLHVLVCGGTGGGLVKVPSASLLNCAELLYVQFPDPVTDRMIVCTPAGLVKTDLPVGGGGDFPEAPVDGTPYERQDASWVKAGAAGVSADAGNVTILGSDGKIYTDALLQSEVRGGENITVNQETDGGVMINAAFPRSLKAQWHYDDVIGAAAPPVGYMHVDTATLDLATVLYMNKEDWLGNSVGDGVNLIRPGDLLILRDSDRDALAVYETVADPVDQGTYFEVSVLYVNGNSTDPAQDDLMDFIWFPTSIAQDLVGEAPKDGTPYERQDGVWVPAGDFRVIVQEFAPDVVTSVEGDEWFRESNGDQFTLHVNDGDGRRQWVAPKGSGGGEVGPAGPQGPAGPAGADGVDGAPGAQGPAGVNRFTVVPRSGAFSATKQDGENVLYDMADDSSILLPTASAGGFAIGDVITLSCATGGIGISSADVTFRVPVNKVNAPFGAGAVIGLVYLSDTVIQTYGDLADA